jgi:hypothetical protein
MFELLGMITRISKAGGASIDPNLAAIYKFLLALAGSIEALILALFFSMILMFVSRRAALRQINASLIEIAQKLNQLEKRGDKGT